MTDALALARVSILFFLGLLLCFVCCFTFLGILFFLFLKALELSLFVFHYLFCCDILMQLPSTPRPRV